MPSSATALRVALSGTAVVCCVHDRRKREVVTERAVAELALELGIVYDARVHRLHECACCGNLFVDEADTPRYCTPCTAPLVHALGGPLAAPIGVVG